MGPSGSGKTTCAALLEAALGIPRVDLDDLFWKNEAGGWNQRRPREERAALLESLARRESWITEGVYCSWLGPLFEKADFIFYLEVPRRLRILRVFLRFLKRRLGGDRRESLADLATLLRWDKDFEPRLIEEYSRLSASRGGVHRVRNRSEALEILGLDPALRRG
jgi:adenylate kinase family enzyme